MLNTTTVTQKGQVTIPLEFRRKLKLGKGKRIEFEILEANTLVLKPVEDFASMRGVFKTKKKYDKKAARKAYAKDLIAGRI